ncbi:energy-coupling factor transporter transmembrane component T family protein [Marinitenerispora sediminis]|uniref:Cobalt transporter n=1 Tax=Marinitenerispora sediminis TaxID=1931232 RepID=A0A368T828_9ACTN|nr:energy-coupling factor transporter transmembrane protein EcfT [Marinitenerispora sediminis]RCV52019.1 cobalt transporter [Marinitenerispora sediminis]RCV56930.1 cobalt transporter [Marinitenerispora sediminis]RCV60052.1 cobalt transporter [Marinitenerispora sediminis]
MTALGLYVPGDTAVHRLPAGAKLAALLVAVTGLLLITDPWAALGAAAAAALLYPLCGLGARHLWRTLRPLLPFLALIAVFQTLVAGGDVAARVCGQLGAAVLLAGLVTSTTRVSAMFELFERLAGPLRVFGVRPDRVALVLAMTIRCVPLVATAWRAAREAYVARGLRRRPHRMVVPVIVNLVRSAEALGEAMSARGLD